MPISAEPAPPKYSYDFDLIWIFSPFQPAKGPEGSAKTGAIVPLAIFRSILVVADGGTDQKMLPDTWLPYLFPAVLRNNRVWARQFAHNRRVWLLGFSEAACLFERYDDRQVLAEASPQFREDPRRIIPVEGWREMLPVVGETRNAEGRFYRSPPPNEVARTKCNKWGQFGKDQADYAWMRRTMRLYDALKAIALLHEAEGNQQTLQPSADGLVHNEGQLSLHLAIFQLSRFNLDYFNTHLASNPGQLAALYDECGLRSHWNGAPANTFYEMAMGMSATERTCAALARFCRAAGLPELGVIRMDLAPRGRARATRAYVKSQRVGPFARYSQDCAIELFFDDILD